MNRTILVGSLLAIALGSAPPVSLGQTGAGQTCTPREASPIRTAGQKQPWKNCPRKPDSQTANAYVRTNRQYRDRQYDETRDDHP